MQPDRRASLKALAVLSGLSMLPIPLSVTPLPTTPEWLILVYMNGKNSLAADAIDDFMEMSAIGSSKAMSIIVQLRIDDPSCNPSTYDGWSGIKRHLINKVTRPIVKKVLVHVGGARISTADIGVIATLDDSIAWGTAKYPAEKKDSRHLESWIGGASSPRQKHASSPCRRAICVSPPGAFGATNLR